MTFEQFLKENYNIHICDDEFWNSYGQFNVSSNKIVELAEEWHNLIKGE
jgi:hypothetical protein